MCIGSTFFFCLVLFGLDLSALVANELEDIVVIEDFGTSVQDLEESAQGSSLDHGERTFIFGGCERVDATSSLESVN